ncbi:DUF6308 family protein [Arthrobacter sp. GCM10027362]|uniref:DUF6308 family protein n=1 Tax=Arthrobacter sp. GCM10027362 TaxID=3273379 RepID=UPI003634FB4B
MRIPEILAGDDVDEAVELVRRYYGTLEDGGRPYTGARFDDFAGGGAHAAVANRITADDLVAVSCLSVHVPARAAVAILDAKAEEIAKLLAEIPADKELADVTDAGFEVLLGPGSPAWQLWDLLKNKGGAKWGIGSTIASKIMARKRPHLIPIWDSVVAGVVGRPDAGGQWAAWHAVVAGNPALRRNLAVIRDKAGVEDLALLRVMDVVLWMHGVMNGQRLPAESVGEGQ